STHDEEAKDDESFDPIVRTPSHDVKTDDEDNDDDSDGMNVEGDERENKEDDVDELYRDVNINLEGRDIQMADVQTTQVIEDTHVTLTSVNPEAVKVNVRLQSDRLRDEAQAKNEDFLNKLDENIQKIIKDQVKEQVKTSYVVAADLSEIELKKILIEKMENNKSIHRSDEQKNLYKALVDAYKCDKLILDTYGDTVTLKRRQDDEDKDEEPFAGSNHGSKRRREGKELKPTSAPKEKTSKTSGKPTEGSKSQHKIASESAPAEDPMLSTQYLEEPAPQEFKTGATDDQSIEQASQHPYWFQKQAKPPTPDRAWNTTLSATHGRIQPWISNLAKKAGSRTSFNELMDTPVDFSAFIMNQLKVDTLTPELLSRPTYDLMKGSCVKNYQKKLNLTNPDTYRSDLKRKEAYTAYSNPKGFIYQNKDKQNRLMRIDELHKFSDGRLNDVRTALDNRLKGIQM
nr:hypothetical protein [Tanacetum cinerariifolium]